MAEFVLADRILLAIVFVVAATTKFADLPGSRQAMKEFGLPEALASPMGALLPLAELAVGFALLVPSLGWFGAIGALILLLGFIIGMLYNMVHGRAPDCHCFGQLHSEPVGWRSLIRNAVLAILALGVVAAGRTTATPELIARLGRLSTDERIGLIIAVALLAVTVGQDFALVRLARSHRDLLMRLQAVEAGHIHPHPNADDTPVIISDTGLRSPPAPSFELPNLEGERVSLEQLLVPGSCSGAHFHGSELRCLHESSASNR